MNRTVVITGSTRGIGFSTAEEFLRHGDRVVIFCRHKKHLDEAVGRLSSIGGKEHILGLVGDVRRGQDVAKIVSQCLKSFGRIDVLVNNAGVAVYKPIEKTTEGDWDSIIDTNLKGTFLFLKQIIPVMKKQGSGIIINVSSGLGVEGMAGFSAYCASKFGVVGLTKVVADELIDSEIRVYAVLPGAVDTTLLADSSLDIDVSDVLKPDYLARRILAAAAGKAKSGTLIEVYS
jgi:NAD(P)-dependent dehydrogenase (short-subunit alcohol dehydrogenase family)